LSPHRAANYMPHPLSKTHPPSKRTRARISRNTTYTQRGSHQHSHGDSPAIGEAHASEARAFELRDIYAGRLRYYVDDIYRESRSGDKTKTVRKKKQYLKKKKEKNRNRFCWLNFLRLNKDRACRLLLSFDYLSNTGVCDVSTSTIRYMFDTIYSIRLFYYTSRYINPGRIKKCSFKSSIYSDLFRARIFNFLTSYIWFFFSFYGSVLLYISMLVRCQRGRERIAYGGQEGASTWNRIPADNQEVIKNVQEEKKEKRKENRIPANYH